MKSLERMSKCHHARGAIMYFMTCCLILNTSIPVVFATPSGGVFTSGTGTIVDGVPDSSVTVNQAQSVIEWGAPGSGGIDTSSGESLTFLQQGGLGLSNSAVLNRIMSGNPTQFDGMLNANDMRIFIVNPAGVVFGGGSHVNVNQLVASGLPMSPEDFEAVLNDPANLMIFNGASGSDVINNGTITANDSVYLVGKNVINNGAISCPAGLVVMAAGDGVYLRQDGSNVFIEVDTASNVTNTGTVTADDGKIVLAAGDTFASAIANVGTLAASGGTVTAEAAVIGNSGTINVDNSDGDGGSVALDAADELEISGTSVITANAGVSNSGANGGDIVAKSNGSITVNDGAQFQARGGSYTDSSVLDEETTYNGGRVEIIGESVYVYGGDVDASTTAEAYEIDDPDSEDLEDIITVTPEAGPWMIDVPELTIADGDIPTDNPEAVENTLYEEWIEAQSQAGTNLELVAHSTAEEYEGDRNTITVEPVGEITGGSGDIALRTKYDTGGITFLPVTGGSRTTIHTNGGGDVYMLAGAGGITAGDIITDVPSSDKVTEPGKIRLYTNNYGDIETGELSVSGGSFDEVSVVACGNLTINGSVETITNQNDNDIKSVGQARTCLVSVHGNVEINGGVTVDAHGKYDTTADVHICAGQNVTVNLDTSERISATAKTSEYGPASASVQIHSGKFVSGSDISITGNGPKPVQVSANSGGGAVNFTSSGNPPVDLEDTDGPEDEEAYAKLEIKEDYEGECPDCPKPPHIDPPIVPNPPVGLPDFGTTAKYDSVSVDVLDNDLGESDLSIILESKDTVNGGKVKLNPYGEVTYTPPEDLSLLSFNEDGEATDTFTYKVMDEGGLVSDIVIVTVTLTNSLPVANLDIAGTLKSSDISIDVLFNDTDNDVLDQLTVLSTSGTSIRGGTVTINPDGTVTYSPPEDLSDVAFDEFGHATDSFTYMATDTFNNSQSEVTVTLINNIPVAAVDTAEVSKNSTNFSINVLANDIDGDELDQLTVLSTSGTSTLGGTITINPDGTVTYNLPADLGALTFDENGHVTDSFTYVATDTFNNSESQVTITVINNLPGAADDAVTTNQNQPVGGNVLNNDIDLDGDTLTVVLNGVSPQNGQLTLNEDGTFTYTPNTGYVGGDSFKYIISDGFNSALGTVMILVGSIAAAPLPEEVEFVISGCPALIQWTAEELEIEGEMIQIWMVNAIASSRDIQPCDACASLKAAATVLQDVDGTYIAALAQVINEFASSTAPPSEEQMASIADAIANNTEEDNALALAGGYIDALVAYVSIVSDLGLMTTEDAITVAADKYVAPLAEGDNVGLATYVAARLTALGQ